MHTAEFPVSIPQYSPPRRISKKLIASDIRAGFRDEDVMVRHGLTRSQLNVVLSALQADGLLDTIHTCPACGLRATEVIIECPRCGVIIEKLSHIQAKRETLGAKIYRLADVVWDRINCGGHRLLMNLTGKGKGRP